MDILIRIDYTELPYTLKKVKGDPGDAIARRTPLAWTCIKSKKSTVFQSHFLRTYNVSVVDLSEINAKLNKFWQISDLS